MSGIFAGAAGSTAAVAAITFSGSLSATGAPTTVTSATRTATVPSGNSGTIEFVSCSEVGANAKAYSIDGAAFVGLNWDDLDSITLTNGQTLALRMSNAGSGESSQCTLRDLTTQTAIDLIDLQSV